MIDTSLLSMSTKEGSTIHSPPLIEILLIWKCCNIDLASTKCNKTFRLRCFRTNYTLPCNPHDPTKVQVHFFAGQNLSLWIKQITCNASILFTLSPQVIQTLWPNFYHWTGVPGGIWIIQTAFPLEFQGSQYGPSQHASFHWPGNRELRTKSCPHFTLFGD